MVLPRVGSGFESPSPFFNLPHTRASGAGINLGYIMSPKHNNMVSRCLFIN